MSSEILAIEEPSIPIAEAVRKALQYEADIEQVRPSIMLEQFRIKRVRPQAEPAEKEALSQLVHDTFVQTFGANYSAADLQAYVDERLNLQAVEQELAQPEAYFYTVAVTLPQQTEQVVGYLKYLVPCQRFLTPKQQQQWQRPFFLERLYFLPEAQGQGVAAVALQWALSLAKAKHQADYAYLSVWEHNLRAQRFYQTHGFRTLQTVTYQVGSSPDREYIYGLRL